MKRLALALGFFAVLLSASACKKQASDSDAIRAGILQHLTAIGTLNMSAMDMDVRSVSVNGNQAHVEVEFRPKTGGAPGAGMHVAYNLEMHDGAWVVLKTQPLGGMIQHPDTTQNRHNHQDEYSDAMPNFNEMLNPSSTTAPGALPPGHPPVTSQQQPSRQPSGQDQTSARKPN